MSVFLRRVVPKLLIAWLLGTAGAIVNAENLYVTPAGAGASNGSDWSNAFAGFGDVVWGSGPGQLGAGDTLWIAGGTYTNSGNLQLKGNGAVGNPIQLKRARSTNTECTAVTGWSSSHDSQVVISAGTWGIWAESTSASGGFGKFTTVDGQVNDGIRINLVQNPLATGIRINGQGAFHSTFRNIGMYGPSTNAVTGSFIWTNEVRGIHVSGYSFSTWVASDVYPSDITFDFCTIAGVVTAIMGQTCQRITFQKNNIHTIECIAGDPHGNIGYFTRCMDLTFRHNEVHDSMFAVGLFFTYFGDGGVRSSNIFIHGNTFRDSTIIADRAIDVRIESTNQGPFYIYNNTFVHMNQGININSPLNPLAQSFIRNNLFVGVKNGAVNTTAGTSAFVTSDHNLVTTNYGVFVDAGATNTLAAPYQWQWARDLRLVSGAAPVNAGMDLGSPYGTDINGGIRGADGAWDIGAHEYTSGTNPPPPVDTTSPEVALISPSPDATLAGSVSLMATATDNVGGSGVASVAFLVDGGVIGTVTVSPYTMAWNSTLVGNGSHTVQARVQDVAGNQALSSTITVTVQNTQSDTTPPSVTMTTPTLNAVVSNNVTLAASATDNVGGSGVAGVTFLVDGVALATATSSPYTVTWNSSGVANGAHGIQARAVDSAGNEALSSSVSITVSNGLAQPPSLTDGLLGWWKFEETAGFAAADSSGNDNLGNRVSPAAWGRGMMGACLTLDGTNGYLRVPSTTALEQISNAVTISAWVLINSNGPMQTIARKVLSENTNAYPYSAYDLVIVDNGTTFFPRMGVTRADTTRGLAYGTGHPYGEWCHIAGTYDGNVLRIYVNGVEEGTALFAGDVLQTNQPLCIGQFGTVTESVRGQIDDFRLYKRALSLLEIQLLSRQPAAVPGVRSVLP